MFYVIYKFYNKSNGNILFRTLIKRLSHLFFTHSVNYYIECEVVKKSGMALIKNLGNFYNRLDILKRYLKYCFDVKYWIFCNKNLLIKLGLL